MRVDYKAAPEILQAENHLSMVAGLGE